MHRLELVDTYKSALEDMTEAQEKLVHQFRESLDVELNHRHTDEIFFKFLRAKNFDLKAARKVFLENYYNRIMFGVDTILEHYRKPEVAKKFESTSFLGFARDGTVIRYTAAGKLDFYGFIMSMSCLELCLYFTYLVEQDIKTLEEENLKTGKNVTEITYIVDLEGFSLQQALHKNVIELGLEFTRLIQDCYPEVWRHVLVVNAPKIFHKAYALFKPVIRAAIRDRLKIIDKASTKYTLLRHIDEDVLPAFLGGNRSDSKGDVLCREFITFGGKVPESYYSKNIRPLLSLDDPEVRLVNIGPRSMFNLSCAVGEDGTELRFLARSENGSLSISLFYRQFGSDPHNPEMPGEHEHLDENAENFKYKQISVQLQSQMHCTQEDVKINAPWPGIYVARISNASNWFTPRKVYLKLMQTAPGTKISSL